MNRKLRITIILLVIVLFISCEEFYTFNLFEGLDVVLLPSVDELDEMSNEEVLGFVGENITSDSFMETLSEDPATYEAVGAELEEIYTDGSVEPAAAQDAAIMASDLHLGVTGGTEVVNNIWNSLDAIESANSGGGDQNTAALIIQSVIPEDVDTPEEMQALINGFLAADEAFTSLGGNLGTNGTATDVEGGVVMNAVVTAMVVSMVNTFTTDPNDAGEVFMAMLAGNDPASAGGVNGTMSTDIFADTYVNNISSAAGMDLSALLGGA